MRTWISSVTVVLILLALIVPPASVGQSTCQLNVPTIKLGVQGIASGAHADYGRQINMGATLAIEEINAGGGILGCKLEMRFMDDENKPATGVKNARFLVNEWGAHFLYGTDSSGIAMAPRTRAETLQGPGPRRSFSVGKRGLYIKKASGGF